MFGPLGGIIISIINFINQVVVPFIMALAFLMFVWGVFNYFIAGGASEEKRQEGQKFVLWSVIAFAVIFSIWGLVRVLMVSFGFGGEYMPPLPHFQGGRMF
jgi:hypothetical protein